MAPEVTITKLASGAYAILVDPNGSQSYIYVRAKHGKSHERIWPLVDFVGKGLPELIEECATKAKAKIRNGFRVFDGGKK